MNKPKRYRVGKAMRCYLATALSISSMVGTAAIAVEQTVNKAPAVEQVVFMVDTSRSMSEPAFGFWGWLSGTSRWDLVVEAFPTWLERVDTSTEIGAISVGGSCGSTPQIQVPVSANPSHIHGIIDDIQPTGKTPLNANLLSSPELFRHAPGKKKRIVLFSDGLNTCRPRRDTCHIAKWLHKEHNITVDVVALITDPAMADQFQCVATAGGGTFWSGEDTEDWFAVPVPIFFRGLLLLLAGLVALLILAAIIFYLLKRKRRGRSRLGIARGYASWRSK